jgi:hypothetical protein
MRGRSDANLRLNAGEAMTTHNKDACFIQVWFEGPEDMERPNNYGFILVTNAIILVLCVLEGISRLGKTQNDTGIA